LLDKLIGRMAEDWKNCDVSDVHMMIRIAYMSRRFSTLIIFSHAIAAILHAIGTLLRIKNNNQTDTRELILKMDLPFEIENTSVYIVTLVIQVIHLASVASLSGVINCFFISLVSLCLFFSITSQYY